MHTWGCKIAQAKFAVLWRGCLRFTHNVVLLWTLCYPAEYMGFLVRNGSDEDTPLLGLQSGTRVPQISDISVDKDGVAIKVRLCCC